MKKVQTVAALLALAVLAIGPAVSWAQEPGAAAEKTLTGQLAGGGSGGYVLIESEGGEEISLKGPDELSEHVGYEVRVTGQWAQDADGNGYFAVSRVERVTSG
jgi:hypothetical protein